MNSNLSSNQTKWYSKYAQILMGIQTILFIFYLFTIFITFVPQSVMAGNPLSRLTLADCVLLFFIVLGGLRNGYRWKIPKMFWALIFYIFTFMLSTFFAHYWGYVMPKCEGRDWKTELAAYLFIAGSFLAICDYLMSLSYLARLRLLQVFIIFSTIWAFIGMWDMVAESNKYIHISPLFAYLYFTPADNLLISYDISFTAAFRSRQQAAFFYFVVAIASVVNMILLSSRKSKLFFGSILWVPWSVVILTNDRSDLIGLFFGTILFFLFALIEKKYIRIKSLLIFWICFMNIFVLGIFFHISPEFKTRTIGKILGTQNKSIKIEKYKNMEENVKTDESIKIDETIKNDETIKIDETIKSHGIVSDLTKESFFYADTVGVWEAFLKHPLGYGFAGYSIVIDQVRIPVHGVYSKALSEGGIFGIFGTIYLLWLMVTSPFQDKTNLYNDKKFMYVYIPLLIGMFVSFIYIHSFSRREMWLLMGFVISLTTNNHSDLMRKIDNLKSSVIS
jgi:hypothetical protein